MTDDRSATQGDLGPEGPDGTAGAAIDTTVPHSARIWNYWLGGKDNYVVDRAVGSYFALYDGANVNEAFNEAQRGYNESGAAPYHLRSPEQFARFFEGLELVEPGVAPVPHWRPDPDPSGKPAEIYSYCGVGRKQ